MPESQAGEHQPDSHLGVDPGSAGVEAIAVGDLVSQPPQVENAVDADRDMIIWNELPQRAAEEQLQFIPLLSPQHLVVSPTIATTC
jgi:hypothetical protein